MNSVSLIGRLTKDPEVRYSESGTAIANFTVAVDRNMSKDQRDQARANGGPTADFIRCVAFNKTAENIGKFFAKGRMIGIEGRIQTGSYTNQEGRTVYTTDVIVRNFSFCGDSGNQNGGYQQNGYPQSNGYNQGYQRQNYSQTPPQQYQNTGYPNYNNSYQQTPVQNQPSYQQMSVDDELPEGFMTIDEDDVPF